MKSLQYLSDNKQGARIMNQETVWQDLEEVSTKEFDDAVKALAEATMEYDQVEVILKDASEKKEAARSKVLELMEKSGKTKYQLDGYGTVSVSRKYSVATPKDNDSKAEMLKYFRSLGADAYLSYVSVNSATLNSYINEQKEKDPTFNIPGVGEPNLIQTIRFTKERKK